MHVIKWAVSRTLWAYCGGVNDWVVTTNRDNGEIRRDKIILPPLNSYLTCETKNIHKIKIGDDYET